MRTPESGSILALVVGPLVLRLLVSSLVDRIAVGAYADASAVVLSNVVADPEASLTAISACRCCPLACAGAVACPHFWACEVVSYARARALVEGHRRHKSCFSVHMAEGVLGGAALEGCVCWLPIWVS